MPTPSFALQQNTKTRDRRRGMELVVVASLVPACAGSIERETRRDLVEVEQQLAPADDPDQRAAQQSTTPQSFDGSLSVYLRYAFEHSPELRASFEEWSAATERPRQVRKLPEPTVTYAGFIRSVETRVGPQRHKLGVMQWFPWPTKLTAGGKAEARAARAAQRRFEAQALDISADVSHAYWRLWFVAREREVLRDQKVVLEGLSEQIRVRVEASMADLSNLAQVNLKVSRLEDELVSLDEEESAASAELVRVLGLDHGVPTPVSPEEPTIGLPSEPRSKLVAAAGDHPRVQSMQELSSAYDERVRRARADRFPSFGVGVDWIITGEATDPSMPESGKDAVIGMAAVKLPLWQGAYGAAQKEARAHGRAWRARKQAAEDQIVAGIDKTLARVRNHARRVSLYETTLVPEAQTAYESVQASYQAGRSTVADVLLAERDLLELETARYRSQRDFAIAWSDLEKTVGRPVVMKAGEKPDV